MQAKAANCTYVIHDMTGDQSYGFVVRRGAQIDIQLLLDSMGRAEAESTRCEAALRLIYLSVLTLVKNKSMTQTLSAKVTFLIGTSNKRSLSL